MNTKTISLICLICLLLFSNTTVFASKYNNLSSSIIRTAPCKPYIDQMLFVLDQTFPLRGNNINHLVKHNKALFIKGGAVQQCFYNIGVKLHNDMRRKYASNRGYNQALETYGINSQFSNHQIIEYFLWLSQALPLAKDNSRIFFEGNTTIHFLLAKFKQNSNILNPQPRNLYESFTYFPTDLLMQKSIDAYIKELKNVLRYAIDATVYHKKIDEN